MKKALKITLALVLTAAMIFAAGCAQKTYDIPTEDNGYAGTVPTISVTGSGKVTATPDTANITFEVNSTGATAEEAQRVIAENITIVKSAVMEKGVAEEDISTNDYYVYQDWVYDKNGRRTEEYSYYAYTSIRVKVRDIDSVSGVIDAAVQAGSNFTGGIWFTLEERSISEGEALKLAYENARKKAEIVCAAAGKKVGEAIIITDGSTAMPEVIYRQDQPMAEAAPEAEDEAGWTDASGATNSSSISPGTVTITANVTVRFVME